MRKFLLIFFSPFICITIIASCNSDDEFIESLIVNTDTTYVNDTVFKRDTIYKSDTIINDFGDTIINADTIINTDTIVNSDTIVNNDTVVIKPFTISEYMAQTARNGDTQAADCYNGLLFHFMDNNDAVFIYNLETKEYLGEVKLTRNTNNHCNNVSFSRTFYEESDEFPLLYVSGGKKNTYNHIQVYRIQRDSSFFNITKVQEITFPTATENNMLYMTNAVMDNEHNLLYIYGYLSGKTIISKMNIPTVHTEKITLTDSDIIETFSLDLSYPNFQGGCIVGEKLYIIYGIPQWGNTKYLRIIDLVKKKDHFTYNLSSYGYGWIEFESLSPYKEGFITASYGNKGIYFIKINK